MIFILLLCYAIYYYQNYVVEYPEVYSHYNMEHILAKMNYLKQKIKWTPWAFHHYAQFILYNWFAYWDTQIAKKIYTTEIISSNDDEELIIAWGITNTRPDAIILFFHTLFGDYSESATFGNQLHKKYNWLPISFSRRGHTNPLKTPVFNTVGHAEDVYIILQKIKERYPDTPIYGLGSSAGTAVLLRYLGETGDKSLIKGAVMLSAGYNFEESQKTHYSLPDKLSIYRAKKFFLEQNKELLQSHNKQAYESLSKVSTIKEWHDHQWIFSGKCKDSKEYFLKHDPIHVLENTTCPILYINAMDDFMFPSKLVKKFQYLVNRCKNKIIIHTDRGSHLGFYEGWLPSSWAYKISEEFLIQIHNNQHLKK